MIFIFLIVFFPEVKLQDHRDPQTQCHGSSCYPKLGDLMVGRAAQLSASSTCGLNRPQNYCIIGYLEGEQKCFICDSRLPYNHYSNPNSHRIENIITTFDPERKTKWWQSENGVHHVSIQLDLESVFQFSHLVLTFKSFRPAAMLVERSKDFGRTWKVFRYFAEDCALHFPSVPNETAFNINDVVCDSRYSEPEPSTGGEVVLKALDPVFEIENPYAANIQELITLTNIRVNFTHLFTLGDTLLTRRRRNPQEKYYYSLYNMVVQGSCFCNGHASQCVPVDRGRGDVFAEPGMVHGRCICQHNTAGENCERCQEFHNNSPWRPGGENTANICRRCNCHGHSDSCHFDEVRYKATGGVSGGVCDGCRHDRTGPQCERCRPFLYQDPRRGLDDPHACIPCDCDPAGSLDGGLCDVLSGQCLCKENVEGQRCNSCKRGFFGLRQDNPTGCDECECHGLGSVGSCDPLTGSCECEPLASGPRCDQCVAGFWGLGNSVFSCSPCDCDIGGAFNSMCSSEVGQCHCLPNMIGRRCSDPAPGYFLPALNYFLYEAELAAPLSGGFSTSLPPSPPSSPSSPLVNPALLPPCEQYFRSQGFDFKLSNGKVVLVRKTRHTSRRRRRLKNGIPLEPGHTLQIIPRQRSADQSGTWTGLGFVRVMEGAGLIFTVDNLPSSMEYQLVIHYEPQSLSDWLATVRIITLLSGDGGCSDNPTASKTMLLPATSKLSILDSGVCLNAEGQYLVEIIFHKKPGTDNLYLLVDSMGLIQKTESGQNFCSQRDLNSVHHFRCIGLTVSPGSQESLLKICEGLIQSLSAKIHNGAIACRCNVVGSLGPACRKLSGFCECKPNIIGRCCDSCAPLTFGFGPEGCKRCECDPQGSVSEMCDQVSGQCACRSHVTGPRCDRCQPRFWDFPRCRLCECNNLSETCDRQTGECQACREHATGPNCERCENGYYGNPVTREPCQACLCPDFLSSGRFFATSCQHDTQSLSVKCSCQEGHTGARCDRCRPGFYGDLTLPGAHCKVCPCNNNIDLNDNKACDSLTGECLHCLYNTMGPQCQHCKSGYYGNALQQDCKECSCDRRGTELTRCPLEGPCFCSPETGLCPCRAGVRGDLCDECEDGFWNLNRESGCQPCSCDPVNSISNICNKVTGQCSCRPEFGGRLCKECGENHFGNPDLQCISCECNLKGTERPSCDPETGDCICRNGVSGIFCDECAPGYFMFPVCKKCHPCTALWTESVTDVQKAAQRMRTFIPRHGNNQRSMDSRHWQQIQDLLSKLDSLGNLMSLSLPKVEKVEKLLLKIRMLKDAIDINTIVIDSSLLFRTEMDNILLEFQKLLTNLKEKHIKYPNVEIKKLQVEELLNDIQKLHKTFMSDEKRLRSSTKAVEDSIDTRQEVKRKLGTCKGRGELAMLEKKVKELSVLKLNQKICGEPDLEDCSECDGGPFCDGVVPVAQKASKTAQEAKEHLIKLPSKLQESNNKINDIQQLAQDTKDQARDLQHRLSSNTGSLEAEKNKTRALFQQFKHYLMDEMVRPDDIEKMAKAVLSIQISRPPAEIRSMISDINDLLNNTPKIQDDVKMLEEGARTAQELLQKAKELKEQIKNTDVEEINRDLSAADRTVKEGHSSLTAAKRDRDQAMDQLKDVEDKLDHMATKHMNQSEELLEEIEALKNKTEQNREMARSARDAADFAVNITDQMDLHNVMMHFELLKQKHTNRTLGDEAADRLKEILMEAKDLERQVEDKLQQIRDLEQKIEQLHKLKKQKAAEVSVLLETVDSLQKEILSRAEEYTTCTI
ncbi:laminin subunit beta-4 [Kryptolebias marmoratus]|uniref:Laminin subunit beta-4-like n=1 Tax=Kryptolebias marmoratus TaxID=37003 RepID=A0A3Q3AVF6_KRYMA|nr:laminin subunit beta-4 [Kryptolebias marmoratus]XP_017281847.1 laminin subunit beta-4 [Kryptolebias marmoratus]